MASLVCAAARIVHVRSRVAELRSSFRGLSLSSSSSVAMQCLFSARTTQPSLQAPAKLLPIQPVVAAGYKLKTHKASAKRFSVTGSGKIVRRQAGRQHLLRKKNAKRKNRLSGKTDVDRSDWQNVLGALPYLKAMK
ncbi:unnamed protein product [Sphagnum troendelagicum]